MFDILMCQHTLEHESFGVKSVSGAFIHHCPTVSPPRPVEQLSSFNCSNFLELLRCMLMLTQIHQQLQWVKIIYLILPYLLLQDFWKTWRNGAQSVSMKFDAH